MPDLPFAAALPQDTRYRDLCVMGAALPQTVFNQDTGEVLAEDIPLYSYYYYPEYDYYYDSSYDSYGYYDTIPENIAFVEKFVGNVSGAKPLEKTCMPMRDTPSISVNSLGPSTFMNMDDRSFVQSGSEDTNYYKSRTFFIGGILGCPDIIYPQDWLKTLLDQKKRENIPERVAMWQFKAENCYNYYILQHATDPWFAMERPSGGTDDPLSIFDPERTVLNDCQPLMRGDWAEYLQRVKWSPRFKAKSKWEAKEMEKSLGFAPVFQYGRPDMDEAEYLLSTYLQRSWNANFVNGSFAGGSNYKLGCVVGTPGCKPSPTGKPGDPGIYSNPQTFFPISLPCVIPVDASGTAQIPPPVPFPHPKPPKPPPKTPKEIQCYVDSAPDDKCGPPYFPMPYHFYRSPVGSGYYCPNVEKITEPSHPFSPRNYTINMTDRDYSERTSLKVAYPNTCSGDTRRGYTYFNEPWFEPWRNTWPAVQCAVVPVDILQSRSEAFNTCITQRINYNFNEWIKAGYPDPSFWTPPCKTRYWEGDDFGACPVKLSIQQCCRIIVKDVTPANFLKMRTCDGLLQARREDKKLIKDITGDADSPPITHITDDDFPWYMGWGGYDAAKHIAAKLNGNKPFSQCQNDESEFSFRYWFGESAGKAYKFPDDPDNPSDKQTGALIGMHMPYMRWWDTGVSAGNPRHGGSFVNTLGGFDELIGVGREERDKQAAKDIAKVAKKDKATAESTRLGKVQLSEMGRIGGWAELKAHQMWTLRRSNLYCIGRYEKLFKPGGAENFVLSKAGAGYTSRKGIQWPWSLGWRGYITDTQGRHEYYPSGVGLDNALPGDIIIYYKGPLQQIAYVTDIGFDLPNPTAATFDRFRNKFVANGTILKPNRVFVVSWDQGKFPTSSGSTIDWGIGPERTIYKQKVPANYAADVCAADFRFLTDPDPSKTDCRTGQMTTALDKNRCINLQCQPTCNDADYSACVLENGKDDWDTVQIYRPYMSVRQCLNGTPTTPAGKTYSLASTYGWTGSTDLTATPDPSVLYQSLTQNVYTNLWAYCVNAGYDPPAHFAKDYKGASTGALTDTTLCGPEWEECSSAAGLNEDFFPEGATPIATPPPYLPDAAPDPAP